MRGFYILLATIFVTLFFCEAPGLANVVFQQKQGDSTREMAEQMSETLSRQLPEQLSKVMPTARKSAQKSAQKPKEESNQSSLQASVSEAVPQSAGQQSSSVSLTQRVNWVQRSAIGSTAIFSISATGRLRVGARPSGPGLMRCASTVG